MLIIAEEENVYIWQPKVPTNEYVERAILVGYGCK